MEKQDCPVLTQDDEIGKALGRLYRLKRLQVLEAPPVLIEQCQKLIELSKERLADRWSEVEQRLALYTEFRDASEKRDEKWRRNCEGCAHFMGYEWMGEDEDEIDRWCTCHKLTTLSSPKPCPDFAVAK
jgi:hypothetical protein